MAKFRVEFCKFSDGTWYTKTETDSPGGAAFVANHNYGRIGRVIDTSTGHITIHNRDVDWDRYKENGVDVEHLR